MTDAPILSNAELARIFDEIGEILEVQGELVFKTVAYHRAAEAIAKCPVDVVAAYRAGKPPRIAGVGEAIAKKLDELAETGQLAYYERLKASIPPGLTEMLRVPGVGPKTVKLLWETLGIESLEELRRGAEAGTLREVRGISARTEASILEGIRALEARPGRMLLGEAEARVAALVAGLAGTPGLRSITPAGSFRRRRETIGDLDLLAETDEPDLLVARFTNLPGVESVIGAGSHKASVRLQGGPQVDLMVMPPGEAGTYLIHFTGSKEHNVRLRGRARDRGWSLSEKGFLRLSEAAGGAERPPSASSDGAATGGASGRPDLRTFPTEAEAYAFLELPWIPPELREDRGEIEAALAGRLPALVEEADLRGDLHAHSDWSDGIHSIEAMAEAARRRGAEYLALTDHSVSLVVARGLSIERVAEQRAIVAELNARFAREEADGVLPEGASPAGFRLLHGCELEIRADATLDYPDELLAAYDIVVAALHVGRRQSREKLTGRVIAAIEHPAVDVIAHPAGRILDGREDLELDWEAVFAAAATTGTALEVNASDARLDLSDERARLAVERGCLLSIGSDAHRTEELGVVRWGIAQARRGWVTRSSIVNARPRDELLAWLAGKPGRVGAARRETSGTA